MKNNVRRKARGERRRSAPIASTAYLSGASRWALTADGAFIDIAQPGSPEIDAARARSLVEFIRKLDAARA